VYATSNSQRKLCSCNSGYGGSGLQCDTCITSTCKSDIGCAPFRQCHNMDTNNSLFYTGCMCNSGLYGNGITSCTQCAAGAISSAGTTSIAGCLQCTNTTPNSDRSRCDCNAGYRYDGTQCVMCPSATLKDHTGKTPSCMQCQSSAMVVLAGSTALTDCTTCSSNTVQLSDGLGCSCATRFAGDGITCTLTAPPSSPGTTGLPGSCTTCSGFLAKIWE